MEDRIPAPQIRNQLNVEEHDFTLYIYAYRAITREEALRVYGQYLKQRHLSRPKPGTWDSISTLFGIDDTERL